MTPVAPRRTRFAILTLFFLAAVTGETLGSFNTPPIVSLTVPFIFAVNTIIYGFSALFMRDVIVRRHLGWPSWILLGAAYGTLNEGVISGQWFVAHVNGLPPGYGHAQGFNWSWIPALTIYHTVYSMIIPILLAQACFPQLADRPWLGKRGFAAIISCLLVVATLAPLAPTYRGGRLIALAIMLVLGGIALRLPRGQPRVLISRPAPGLWTLRWAGFGLSVLMFASFYLAAKLLPAMVTGLLLVLFGVFLIWRLRTWTARENWTSRQSVAVISGSFGMIMLLALLPSSILSGELFAELLFLGFLIWLARYTKRSAAAYSG